MQRGLLAAVDHYRTFRSIFYNGACEVSARLGSRENRRGVVAQATTPRSRLLLIRTSA